MTCCSKDGCELEAYEGNDEGNKECILHCKKGGLSFDTPDNNERNSFYSAFLKYLIDNLIDDINNDISIYSDGPITRSHKKNTIFSKMDEKERYLKLKDILTDKEVNIKFSLLHIKDIHFPWVDTQTALQYRDLLQKFKEINFETCYFYHDSLELEDQKVFFYNCTFENNWQLTSYDLLKNADSVIYSHCNFEKKVSNINGLTRLNISLFNSGCSFKEGFELKNLIIEKNIFNDYKQDNSKKNIFNDDNQNNSKKTMNGLFKFINCHFIVNQEFYLTGTENAGFEFQECKFDKKFKIRGKEHDNYKEDQENKTSLKSLTLSNCKLKNSDETYLRIGFLKNCELIIDNLRNQANSEMNIGDCHFKRFILSNFRNSGKFKLYKINTLPDEYNINKSQNDLFQIDNTSIGRTDFQSINLSSFKKVTIFDNLLTEIDYTNMQWKKEIEVGQCESEKCKIAKKRDTYRTLKNIAQRNNDQPQSLIFYAQEMEKHYEITKQSSNRLDKTILRFNKWTNEFGLNWWRPIWVLFFLSILFYALLESSTSSLCSFELEKYFVFLNPTHKTEFIAEGCWTFCTYCIDFSFRIIEALLIYQAIQAFRKFSRKL